MNDLRFAIRQLLKNPGFTAVAVLTLALGLGPVAAVFTIFNAVFLRVDAVQHPGELFSATRQTRPGAESLKPFTRAEYEAIRRETNVFADAIAIVRSIETRIEGRPVNSAFVTGNFFHTLGVQAALGRTLTRADDDSAGRLIVLSHKGWIKLVAGDQTVIGRSLPINGVQCEVVGVMPEEFRGLTIGPPDYWAPLGLAREFRQTNAGGEEEMPVGEIVGRLKPGVSPEQATAGLNVWASGRTNLKADENRPGPITLKPSQGTFPVEFLAVFAPIFFAFALILMIGCANVANLLLARAVSRQREIGVRLALGASRWRLIRQLLTESLILALASAACAFFVSRICLEGAVYATIATMPVEVAEQVQFGAPTADWRMLVFLIAAAIVSTVSFGLAPALRATRVDLVRAIRGQVTGDARPGRTRHVLISVQVGTSTLLLICAVVFLRSAYAAATTDPGVRTSDTVMVPIANETRRAAIIRELTTHPLVVAMATSSAAARAEASVVAEVTAEKQVDDSAEVRRSLPVNYKSVSPEYFQLLDINLIGGRSFTDAERTADAGIAVVSEGTARRLWPNRDAIGQAVRLQAEDAADRQKPGPSPSPFRAYTIIGVVKDVGGDNMFQSFSYSGLYLPADPLSAGNSLVLRVQGDPGKARLALLDRLTRVDPALDHEIRTMRTVAGIGTYILQIAFWVTLVLGALALALTVSGLFGVLSYLVEQSAKEIGVRLALGATTRNIAGLVLLQLVHPVGFGILAGSGLAAALATVLISTPFAAEIGKTVLVLDPVAYVASVLVIATASIMAASIPAWRAVRLDPITTLRRD